MTSHNDQRIARSQASMASSIEAESEAVQSGCSSLSPHRSVGDETKMSSDEGLESPSRVLGGTSWTGGLAPGCVAGVMHSVKTPSTSTSTSTSAHSTLSPGLVTVRGGATLDHLRQWTMSTYKCGRQSLMERLGRSTRTVDAELEAQIADLRLTQKKYGDVVRLTRALANHLQHLSDTQGQLADLMADLSNKEIALRTSFQANGECHRLTSRSGERLAMTLNEFVSSVNTLCHKTMDDTLITVRHFEVARVEFDAYRDDLERVTTSNEVNELRRREAERQFEKQREEFERLRADVQVKLRFLNDNKVKVMRNQLDLLLEAVAAYFNDNGQKLEECLNDMRENVDIEARHETTWIEK